nr:hypothetical protein [Tanacetum cinerariifolium]
HTPGARTSAFHEVLHRETLGEQRVQVFVEDGGVQRVAFERTAHEERTATPQQAADDRHVQVDAGRNVRRRQPVAEQQHHFQKADRRVGVIRGDFVAVVQGFLAGLGFRNFLPCGFVENGLLDQGIGDQPFHQIAAVRKIGADGGGLEVAEMHAQQTL